MPQPERMELEDGSPESWEEEKERRADWTPEQDFYMSSMVTVYGPHNWSSIADYMNARFQGERKTSKQCRERWYNKLDPAISHSPWTKQEEAVLILSHMKFKNRWCDIANALKGRHNNMIKNRFYSIFRKVKNKIKNGDFAFRTKLELYEMYYMISVMQDYVANPLPPDEPKRKRGRDFMYTLIDDIDTNIIEEFKQNLLKRSPLKAPLEQVLNDVVSAPQTNSGTRGTPVRPVSNIPMSFCEAPARDLLPSFGDLLRTRPAMPVITCGSKKLTLPEPRSYMCKELLTADEKDSFKQTAFTFSRASAPFSEGRTMFGTPPFRSWHYSPETGREAERGGFEAFSRQGAAMVDAGRSAVPAPDKCLSRQLT